MADYLNNGCGLIAKERDRQINELGYDVKHDELYSNNQLANAAICYAMTSDDRQFENEEGASLDVVLWPWEESDFKPTPNDRIRELVKAGALIAAQIDREIYELEKQSKNE